jgi:hypothetical protein
MKIISTVRLLWPLWWTSYVLILVFCIEQFRGAGAEGATAFF